ncbi:RNA polymerase sigma factor [Algoriphagus namhaensis]
MKQTELNHQLISQVILQDRKAQYQLFELTKNMIYSLAYRVLNDEDEAHDVLQDTYVEVFQNIQKLSHPEALTAWMKTIAARKAIQRSKKRLQFEPLDQIENSTDDFESWFDAEMLEQAIFGLPDGARAVFVLIAVEGYPHKECAELLGVSESTSKSQYSYAKGLLRARITKLLQA